MVWQERHPEVVPHASFTGKHEAGIIEDFRRIIGDEMAIRVEVVDHIARTRTGKFRFVVREGSAAELA